MRRRVVIAVSFLVVAVGLIVGVVWVVALAGGAKQNDSSAPPSETRDHRTFTTTDPWCVPLEESTHDWGGVGKDHFAVVSEPLQPEAQGMLKDVPAKRLTADEATRLTGKQLPTDGEYVLLRGVVLNESGKFHVYIGGDDVLVSHNCLGHYPVPVKRKAIVAVLPAMPKSVYVTCGMDE